MGSYKAACAFNAPPSAPERCVKIVHKFLSDVVQIKIGRKPVLPPAMETDLAEYCPIMEQRIFCLMQKVVCRMAHQPAVSNGIANPFSKDIEQAGNKWMRNFLKRNSQPAVRTPQGLSFARANGFTPEAISRFFDISESSMEKIHHSPSRLYNCDETGITVVQHKHTEVVWV
jgi:hypothetical protein